MHGSSLNYNFLITYFPKELKIIEYYFSKYVQDDSATLPEKYYFFKNKLTERPKCSCDKCNNAAEFIHTSYYTGYGSYCKNHHGKVHPRSAKEKDLFAFVQEFLSDATYSNRSMIKGELDIFSLSKNLAIEFNGTYFHSYLFSHDKERQYDKWKKCIDKNIRLITIWEDDWDYKQDVVKAFLKKEIENESDYRITNVRSLPNQDIKLLTEKSLFSFDNTLDYDICYSDDVLLGLIGYKDKVIIQVITFKYPNELLLKQYLKIKSFNEIYCYLDVDNYFEYKKLFLNYKESWIEEKLLKYANSNKYECYSAGIVKFQKE